MDSLLFENVSFIILDPMKDQHSTGISEKEMVGSEQKRNEGVKGTCSSLSYK